MFERLGLVDACGMDEWEADRRSRLANHLLFWIWYLPLDLVVVARGARSLRIGGGRSGG